MTKTSSLPIEVRGSAKQPLGMSPAQFLRDYWQKRPLLIRQAFPDFVSPIEPNDLAGLAMEETALSRLIIHDEGRDRWKVKTGPLTEKDFASTPDKKSYWLQLSAVNSELQKYEDAVAAMEIAYRGGILTEDAEIRRLCELLLYVGIPYRGATTLQKAIADDKVKADKKTYETLANAWIAAREYDKAAQPLGQAAALHENGDLYVRLAEVLMQREKWPEAQDALQRALDKGKLKDTGNTKLLMGIAVYSQKKPGEARTWFQQAREYPNERKAADGWLQHINSEQNSGR